MSSRPSRGAARLAAILDALPDALLLVNCNGTVVNANAIALEAFETPGTALVGRGLLDLLPEFDSKRIPGSMRRPEEAAAAAQGRQKPTRMVARRTDGTEFPVEVTSANLEDGRTPYASAIDAAFADHPGGAGYTGDELLMLVVRDLTGTLDTEAELARQQRQTEMILRAASEGVVGVDTEGRVVLVNPAAAHILGYRASDLGGQELHPLVHHSRPDGAPLPYEETPLADTLRSGRKHRVRAGQVLWAKNGRAVPVDMTTAPVRDGDQLVGAVLTFADRRPFDAVTARQDQLRAVLEESLRGPLERLREELSALASDPAGQLWPEANQILHHLSAGYARMTTLVDNVLGYQRLDAGKERLRTEPVPMDAVVSAGVEGAVELIGPGRAQFAVHAPPIEAEVDPERLAVALAHLVADVAGVDATGAAASAPPPGVDPTIVVAAAQRGEVVRIEVRGPYGGGSPVHEPLVRGIVDQHGGVLQTHEVPGSAGGSAYVLEVPVKAVGNTARPSGTRARRAGTNGTDGTGGANSTSGTHRTDGANGTDGTGGSGSSGGGRSGSHAGGRGHARRAASDTGGGTGGTGGTGVGAFGVPGVVQGTEHGETTVMPMPSAPARGTGGTGRTAAEEFRGDGPGPQAVPGQGATQDPGQHSGQGGASAGRGRAHPPGPGRELEQGPGPQVPAPGPAHGPQQSRGPQQGVPGPGGQGAGAPMAGGLEPVRDPRQGPPALDHVPDPRQSLELGPGPSASPSTGRGGPGDGSGGPSPALPDPSGAYALAPARTSAARIPAQTPQAAQTPQQAAQEAPHGAPGEGMAHEAAREGTASAPPSEEAYEEGAAVPRPTGRRRRRPSPDEEQHEQAGTGGESATRDAAGPLALPPVPAQGSGRRARRALTDPAEEASGPYGSGAAAQPGETDPQPGEAVQHAGGPAAYAGGPYAEDAGQEAPYGEGAFGPGGPEAAGDVSGGLELPSAGGRRARRIAAARARAQAEAEAQQGPRHAPFALPPVPASDASEELAAPADAAPQDVRPELPQEVPQEPGQGFPDADAADSGAGSSTGTGAPGSDPAQPRDHSVVAASPILGGGPYPQHTPGQQATGRSSGAQPHPGAPPSGGQSSGGQPGTPADPYGADQGPRVRTLGQGLPFTERMAEQAAQQWPGSPSSAPSASSAIPSTPSTPAPPPGTGRRRKLATPQERPTGRSGTAPAPGGPEDTQQSAPEAGPVSQPLPRPQPQHQPLPQPQPRSPSPSQSGEDVTEGPEPLDGPDSPVAMTDGRSPGMPPHARDDELPPEPLDNPRRLLVWPEPDVSTQQALSDRGYRPVLVRSREEVDAQIAAYPAALFVDPLTGPITRTALQSLRTAAVAAEVPVLVTAGLGQATREAAFGADPAVLLKALAPRDSEQHPPRVLLVEEQQAVAAAFAATLERRGMRVAHAPTDADAVNIAAQVRPNLVVMDLMQVRRRRAGIIDWLRVNGMLNRTPFVVYTSADLDPGELPRLASGETVLFLAERSTSAEVQSRIVDLLAKIGAN